jgi:hypothetical protein
MDDNLETHPTGIYMEQYDKNCLPPALFCGHEGNMALQFYIFSLRQIFMPFSSFFVSMLAVNGIVSTLLH